MANQISVRLNKGDASSWGFRLQGGKDFGTPLIIQKINSGTPAENAGLRPGDAVIRINNVEVFNLRHKDAQDVILRAGPSFEVTVQRGGLTWKPAVSPVGSLASPRPTQPVNNISPVTATSLAAGRQENIGAIGTSHNVAAKPYNAVNGGPALVNKQYNSPLNLYSDQSIAETISAQSEVLSNGVVGVNFKKNEKSYDATNSAVFRMVQEADKEPRDYEQVNRSDFYDTHSHAIGSHRHIDHSQIYKSSEEEHKIYAQNHQVTTCTDCERVIVGVFVRIKDKNLHVECFKCSTCGSSLKNVGYYNLNNKLYCDVHAKLAVKNNPPAPNLAPVTVSPGGQIPLGTISAALASHPLPSAGPLSPNSSYSPIYQPTGRPYSGVSAPISPTNSLPKYSSPAAPHPARCAQNTVWPPLPKEPDLPTASPLYFPPPSQVQILQKPKYEETEISEPDDLSYRTPLGSLEILNITGGRCVMDSSETVSNTLDTQMLVDSVLKSNPPNQSWSNPGDVAVSFTISEAELQKGYCTKSCKDMTLKKETAESSSELKNYDSSCYLMQEQQCSYKSTTSKIQETNEELKTCLKQEHPHITSSVCETAVKVENTIPQKWESAMVVALTVAPKEPYSPIPSEPEMFLQTNEQETKTCLKQEHPQLPIKPKRSTSALAAALAVAPSEPFTPVSQSSLERISLPELTIPYFPPEHPKVIEPKETNEEELDKPSKTTTAKRAVFGSKRKKDTELDVDEIFKDLPKPAGKLTMLGALTTAPERPYSPFSQNEEPLRSESCEPEPEQIHQDETKIQPPVPKQKFFPKPEFCAAVFTAPERLYSPFTANKSGYESEIVQSEKSLKSISSQERSVEKHETKNIQTTENVTNVSTGCPPLIHSIRSTFETKTDKVHMEMSCAFPTEPVTTKRIIEKKTDVLEEKTTCDKHSSQQQTLHEEKQKSKNIKMIENVECAARAQQIIHEEKQISKNLKVIENVECAASSQNQQISENVKYQSAKVEVKPKVQPFERQTKQVVSSGQLNQNAASESTLIQQACTRIQNTGQIQQTNERVTVIRPGQTNLNVPQIAFQPVSDDSEHSTFSPRPLTPSMINKPAPTLPYYQANLVATQQPAAAASIYDPKSPAHSRSPSPYPGMASPLPAMTVRAVSPAPGPPANPLKSNTSIATIMHNDKIDQARNYVQTFIPQHQTGNIHGQASNIHQSSAASQVESISDASSYQPISVASSVSNKTNCQQTSSSGLTSVESRSQFISNQQGQSFEQANVAKQTLQISGDNIVQVQHKKVITEEFERGQNIAQLEKHSGSLVRATAQSGELGVLGMHVTNPQPIKSPFIQGRKQAQNVLPQKTVLPTATPQLTKTLPAPKTASSVNVKPNVSQPNAGTGGGRQSGAVGVAPRRGRGVLNLSATPGSRVPLCAHCHANIRGPFITALGKLWCPDHFTCATPSCKRPLQDLGFVEEQGQLYCEFCFEKYLAPLCAKCNTKVKGDCLKAIGKTFHPECFNCAYCGKLFGNSPFFLEDAQPYCETDWNELFTTKCFACGFPVEAGDRWVEALNNNYHSQCFNCTMCKKNLEGQSFFAKGGRPFCKNHAR